jgi:hypothetical protein
MNLNRILTGKMKEMDSVEGENDLIKMHHLFNLLNKVIEYMEYIGG